MWLTLTEGMPQWVGYAYGAAAAVAAITDYRKGKIYNWLTFPLLGLGLVLAFLLGGWHTLGNAAAGAGLALILFAPLSLASVFGFGDVKLLMALGTVLGPRGVFELACTSILIAGAGSVVLLIRSGRLRPFLNQMWVFLSSITTPGLAAHWPRLDRTSKAPFGIAIFWGLVIVLLRGNG